MNECFEPVKHKGASSYPYKKIKMGSYDHHLKSSSNGAEHIDMPP